MTYDLDEDSDDTFALYFHHGGKFTRLGGARFYSGGDYVRRTGFEQDKFGYFDVVDEVEKLGYEKWVCIAYKIPKSLVFMDLKDDKDVMAMLRNVTEKCRCLSIYVDGGSKRSSNETGSEDVLTAGMDSKVCKGKERAVNLGSEKEGRERIKGKGKVVKAVQDPKMCKGKEKEVTVGSEKAVRESNKGKGKVVKAVQDPKVCKGKEKAVTVGSEKAVRESNKGKGKVVNAVQRKDKAKVLQPEKMQKGQSSKKKEADRASEIEEDLGKFSALWKDLANFNEESDSDISWHDSDEDDVAIETDDSLGDDELGSGDEEYIEARQNITQEEARIDFLGGTFGQEGRYGVDGYLSDYVDSDEDVISESSEDEDEFEDTFPRRRIPKKMYDPKCDHKDLKLCLGMRFADGFECKKALKNWAILKGHPIHFRRVSKNQLQAYCDPPCPWKCYGSMLPKTQIFKIKTMGQPHDCGFDTGNKQADYKWIAEQYLDVFRVRPTFTVGEFEMDVKHRFQLEVSRGRLHRAKHHAFELLRGTVKQHYNLLRNYISELMRVDREGRFELLVGEGSIFKGLYIGFSALKKGFMEGCRWIIGLDGCHLKTYLGGQLLCATAKDGNIQMYPIAWAVVEIENEECWSWFVKTLLEELGVSDGLGLTIISDQQKGLINAVREYAPFAEHRNCARHVYCNWKKQFKGATLKNLFWRAVRCTYQEEWDLAVADIQAENSRAYDNFMEREPARFCKTFISTQCVSDMVDNNVSETFNGYIVRARSKHIIHMLEDIRSALRERQYIKLEMIKKVTDKICPNIRKKLEKLKADSRYCTARLGIDRTFEVKHINSDMFIVSLEKRTCTCRMWDITGIPCIHGLSAIQFSRHDPADYVNKCFTVETYLKAYSFGLQAINGQRMWPKAHGYPVEPPLIRKMPGRPKKKRRRDHDEPDPKNPNRLRKLGVQMTCQNCLQTGHNARGCKNPTVQKPQKEPGKRGRPRKTVTAAPANSSASQASSRLNAKKRAQARKGIGRLVCEETGDAYLHMSTGSHVYYAPFQSSHATTRSASQATSSQPNSVSGEGNTSHTSRVFLDIPTQGATQNSQIGMGQTSAADGFRSLQS